ncbi:MAG: heat-shock protein Hsp15 [Acidobacteria bacterium]|nr:MAG: heat-shock protein Hsp15 [Acidobacteriota bacterium]
MRLDLFLKVSRLVLRRSVAQELCDAGMIFVNELRAKASKEIKPGDRIEIRRRTRHTSVEVTIIPSSKQVSKHAAAELYRLLEDTPIDDDPTN